VPPVLALRLETREKGNPWPPGGQFWGTLTCPDVGRVVK
jgi:hypothetical protein